MLHKQKTQVMRTRAIGTTALWSLSDSEGMLHAMQETLNWVL